MQNHSYLEHSDEELLHLSSVGDPDAFGELARRYRPLAFSAARFILNDDHEAEEQVQEALVKAFQHMDRFRRDSKFSTWLVRIAVNQSLMHLRKFRRVKLLPIDSLQGETKFWPATAIDGSPSPEMQVQATQTAEVLHREIRRIPPLLRNVFLLRDVEERPMPDVAKALGISVDAAKSRLLRARAELHLRLKRHLGRPPRTIPEAAREA